MNYIQRPRVAAIGLTAEEVSVLRRYEGTVYEAPNLWEFLNGEDARSFAETDLLVGRLRQDGGYMTTVPQDVHLLLIEGVESVSYTHLTLPTILRV